MLYAPIYGSQFNPTAKLFKRFTPTETVTIKGDEIRFENNYYARTNHIIRWTEADDMQQTNENTPNGSIGHTQVMTIKFHGRWKPIEGGLDEPEEGDVLCIDKEYWIIEEGIRRARKKSLINFATIYLPIRKLI